MAEFNPDKYQQTEEAPLFAGQNTHPLTPQEWKLLEKRFDKPSSVFSPSSRKRVDDALTEIAKTPTGREQLREIINAEPKDRQFKIRTKKPNAYEKQQGILGGYSPDTDMIVLRDDGSLSLDCLGNTIIHELNHARYMSANTTKVFADSETQALSAQMAVENKDKTSYDAVYDENYQNNLKDWRLIAEGKKDLPKWAKDKPFQYQPSEKEQREGKNNPERVAQAREMYARQMASLETRGKYIEDFYSSNHSLERGYHSDGKFSYKGYSLTNNYKEQEFKVMNARQQLEQNNKSHVTKRGETLAYEADDTAGIRDVASRYPVNAERMLHRSKDIKSELSREFEQRQTGEYDETMQTEAQRRGMSEEEIEKRWNKMCETEEAIQNNEKLSPLQKEERLFNVYVQNADIMTPDDLEKSMRICLEQHQQHQPDRNPTRDKMVRQYEKLTGKKIPLASNDETKSSEGGDLKKRLREAGNAVDVNTVEQDNSRVLSAGNDCAMA